MKLSIIIPAYNEKNTILNVLDMLEKVVLPNDMNKEIIIVDDGSNDGTADILKSIGEKYKIIYQSKNEGKGSAIRQGLKEVSGDIIMIQDADLEYSPDDIPALLKPILQDNVFVVYGSRFMHAGHVPRYRIYYLGNKLLSSLFSIIYGQKIIDIETCYKLMRAEVLNGITITSNRFNFEPEITAKIVKQGYVIKELPISYNSRSFKEGKKIGWKDGISAIITMIRYRFTK